MGALLNPRNESADLLLRQVRLTTSMSRTTGVNAPFSPSW
jgi:hypothetical protein